VITFLRFIWYLLQPLLVPLMLPFLLVAWVILALVCAILNTWYRAKRDPRYDPYLL
jgi:hypothetical protein